MKHTEILIINKGLDNRTLPHGAVLWYSLGTSLKSLDLSELQLSDESKRGLRGSWTHHFWAVEII